MKGGKTVHPGDHFPFLGEPEQEMSPEDTQEFFESLALQMGGSREGDDAEGP